MTVLVTGGAGFIGSHVVDRLVDDGADVRVLDLIGPDRPTRTDGSVGHHHPDVDHVVADVTDAEAVRAAVAGVDAVCHQAARVGLGVDFSDAPGYVHDNDLGTAVLLRAMYEAGFAGRLVLASSMVVYGEGRYRCTTHGVVGAGPRRPDDLERGRFEPPCPHCGRPLVGEAVGEDAPADPRNVYAATKLHQEHLCAIYGRETGNPVLSLRCHNVYGPRMPRDTPYAGVASLFLSALRSGRAPHVFEDGGQQRDFVHVGDVARANVVALGAAGSITGAVNVASGEPRSVGEMADALADACGPDAPRPTVTGEWRLGDVRHVVASPERARRELGFVAEVSFADGMAELAAERMD